MLLCYFILQLAKLRMIAFYYNFPDVYMSRKDFKMCQMDIDSFYMDAVQLSDGDLEMNQTLFEAVAG